MLLAIAVPDASDGAMYWRRDFPGRTDQVRFVRLFAAHLLNGLPNLDDVLLALDELAVNAIRHTRSGEDASRFTVHIGKDAARVVVCVDDQGGLGDPCVRELDELAEGGRGLLTVDVLAATWSWRGDEDGRTVRATFPHAAWTARGLRDRSDRLDCLVDCFGGRMWICPSLHFEVYGPCHEICA